MSRELRAACSRGHEYTEANTYWMTNGWRSCRACAAAARRRRRREKRAREGREPGPRRGIKAELFWQKVDRGAGCWLWIGLLDRDGIYGRYSSTGAHRIAYRLAKGEIPPGFEVDHLCFVPLCVNPDHLEAVTPEENQRRRRARTTSCRRGHPHSPENTYVTKRGQRQCRVCQRITEAARRATA